MGFLQAARTNCLSPGRSKVNQGAGQQNLVHSSILLTCHRGTKKNGVDVYGQGQHIWRVELYNMIKCPSVVY